MAMSFNELSSTLDFCAPWTPTLGECLDAAGCERVCPAHADTNPEDTSALETAPCR